MTDVVTVPHAPALAVIRDVPICEVGHWEHVSTGPVDFSPEDFESAVAALEDPAISRPYIRLGHADDGKRGVSSGEPAVGYLQNMYVTEDRMQLRADLVGLPAWLAEVMASAFPNRSIDGLFNWRTSTGNDHRFVVQGLCLLGIYWPGCETLEDIASLYGVAMSGEELSSESRSVVVDVGAPVGAYVRAMGRRGSTIPDVPPRQVSASVSTEDIRRLYYDSLSSGQVYWWVREINLDPYELIVMTDEDDLMRVPFEIDGVDVVFGDPVEVRVVYVDASSAPRRAASTVYASRAESRPEGASPMDIAALRQALGLAEDVSEEDVLARAAEVAAEATSLREQLATDPPPPVDPPEPPAPAPPPPTGVIPVGATLIDAAALAQLQTQARQGAEAATTLRLQERARFIGEVRASGRIAATQSELVSSLEREWDRDPEAARRVAASLAVVAPTVPVGHGLPGDASDDDQVYEALFGGGEAK